MGKVYQMKEKDRYKIVKRDPDNDEDNYILIDRKNGHHVNIGSWKKCWGMKMIREGYENQ